MQNYFTNKVIWITGASSGIGRALAIEFSKLNVKLVISARNQEELTNTKNLCSTSSNVFILPLDLAKPDEMQAKTEQVIAEFGAIDILVNNGGISQRSYVKDTPLSVDRKLFEINYFGTISLTKAVLPYFLKQKSGQFVVTSSVTGKFGSPLRSSYSASKHALHGFFDSLRAEVHDDNIAVLIFCPGYVNTNVSKNALNETGGQTNVMDANTQNGESAESLAKKYIKAIYKKKSERYTGRKEKMGVYIKRFLPGVFEKMIRKANVT